MKYPWLAYVIVALLSIGAGVAIAGLPDNAPVDATIVSPATDAAATTVAPTTDAPSTTEAAPETTEVPATSQPETTEPSTTDPETTEPETTAPDTTDPETTDPDGLPDRSELIVTTANGANVAGAALRVANRLEEIGYADVVPRNGSEIVEFTIVYFADGFEDAALRLAEDLDVIADFIAPLENAPTVVELPDDVELLAYVGLDRAG